MNKKLGKALVVGAVALSSLGMALGLTGCADKEKSPPGESAYEIAVRHGFVGTEAEWLASLKGGKGDKGDALDAMPDITIGLNGNWYINGTDTGIPARGEKGEPGDSASEQGPPGLSAYEIWCKVFGNTLTEAEWLELYVKGKTEWTDYDLELQMMIIALQFQIDDTATISRNLTIPDGVRLIVPDGKTLIVPNGKELTVRGTLINHDAGHVSVEDGGKITVVSGGLLTSKGGLKGAGNVEFRAGAYFYNNDGMDAGENITYTFNQGAIYIEDVGTVANGVLPKMISELPAAGGDVTYFLKSAISETPGDGITGPVAVLSQYAKLVITESAGELVWTFETYVNQTTKFGTQSSNRRYAVAGGGTLEITGVYTMDSDAVLEIVAGATVKVTNSLIVNTGAELDNRGTVSIAKDAKLNMAEGLIITIPPDAPPTIEGTVPGGGTFEIVGDYLVAGGKTLTVPVDAMLRITGGVLTITSTATYNDLGPVIGTVIIEE